MKLLQLWTVAFAICCVCGVVEAEAAATVTLKPSSDGSVYSVLIANVVNAPAIDFVINCDTSAGLKSIESVIDRFQAAVPR